MLSTARGEKHRATRYGKAAFRVSLFFLSEGFLFKLNTGWREEKKTFQKCCSDLKKKHDCYSNGKELRFGISKGMDRMRCNQKMQPPL